MEAGLLDQRIAAVDDDLGREQAPSAWHLAQQAIAPCLIWQQLSSSRDPGLQSPSPLGPPQLFHLVGQADSWACRALAPPTLPAQMLYQDIEQHVEMMGDPEALEADVPEVAGGKHIHHSQDHEQQHSRHACE